MSSNSATGSATPSSLYKLYKNCGAVAANPCTLRRQFGSAMAQDAAVHLNLLGLKGASSQNGGYSQLSSSAPPPSVSSYMQIQRSSSPPKMAFRQLPSASDSSKKHGGSNVPRTISLTLASLDMNRR